MIFGASPFFCWFSAHLGLSYGSELSCGFELSYGIKLSCGNREPATEYDRSGQ